MPLTGGRSHGSRASRRRGGWTLCRDTGQGTGALPLHRCHDRAALGLRGSPGHGQLPEVALGQPERPQHSGGAAGSTLGRGGTSLPTSAQKPLGRREWMLLKTQVQTLSAVWQQLTGREQVDAPPPVLLKAERVQSSATGCGVGCAQQPRRRSWAPERWARNRNGPLTALPPAP